MATSNILMNGMKRMMCNTAHQESCRQWSSHRRYRAGLSLIEVVGSIALLVTMFVMILKAWTIHQQQIHRAELLMTAVRLLDQQMTTWYSNPNGPPVNTTGGFSATTPLYWETRLLAKTTDLLPGMQKLQVTVFEKANEQIFATEVIVPVAETDSPTETEENQAPVPTGQP